MISKKELLELTEISGTPCISIFIPTHRAGQETLKGKDSLNLKNQMKQVRNKLSEKGVNKHEIENLIKPLSDLVNDSDFWRHQSDGLAVFISKDFFRKFLTPVVFEELNYVSDQFYVIPVLPLFNADGRFYLLTLKMDEVNFYEGTKFNLSEVKIDELTPSRLEDVVGYDYEQRILQFRSQQTGIHGEGSFHGHASNEEKGKDEIMRFFQAVDRGLMTFLHDDQMPPLVIASLDYHFPLYREVNTYKNLFPKHISGNPAEMDTSNLHKKAWELLEPEFKKERLQKKYKFEELYNSDKTSSDIREILPAAYLGRVDILFLEKNSDIFGQFNPVSNETTIDTDQHASNISLMNLAAAKVSEQKGRIYIQEKEEMPDPSSKINALFRY